MPRQHGCSKSTESAVGTNDSATHIVRSPIHPPRPPACLPPKKQSQRRMRCCTARQGYGDAHRPGISGGHCQTSGLGGCSTYGCRRHRHARTTPFHHPSSRRDRRLQFRAKHAAERAPANMSTTQLTRMAETPQVGAARGEGWACGLHRLLHPSRNFTQAGCPDCVCQLQP